MKVFRTALVLAVLAIAAYVAYRYVLQPRRQPADTILVYYCKTDGETLVPWRVSLGPKRDRLSVATYALAQSLVGPPPPTDAIRFPPGTIVRGVRFTGSTVITDLAGSIAGSTGGSFAEAGEFKALVWTMTALSGIASVQVEINGETVSALPGGHLELDRPLSRSNF